jgi:hypothetical protein
VFDIKSLRIKDSSIAGLLYAVIEIPDLPVKYYLVLEILWRGKKTKK